MELVLHSPKHMSVLLRTVGCIGFICTKAGDRVFVRPDYANSQTDDWNFVYGLTADEVYTYTEREPDALP